MFSLFGGNKPPTNNAEPAGVNVQAPPMEERVRKVSEGRASESIVNFDPSGLERAAKAARELDESKNSKVAAEIIMNQEKTAQLEWQARVKEYEAQARSMEIKKVQTEQEERRKTIEMETSHINYRNKQQDEMARRRNQEQAESQKRLQEEMLRKQEESTMKQELARRQTIEYEKTLERTNDQVKIEAETRGKIEHDRATRDIKIETLKVQAAEARETVLQSIKALGETVGSGFKEFISDKEKVGTTVAAVTLLALGVYGARSGTSVIGKYVESIIGKPPLVRETSRISFLSMLRNPLKGLKEIKRIRDSRDKDLLKGVILHPSLEERLRSVSWTTINAKRNRAPFRNMLLYGPPGTGKTMFAKSLALNSGMDYAIMTGGDVAPLGREVVNEMHKLFDWSAKSKKGLILFVDEADAFLKKRNKDAISEEMRNAINAFLYRTGESSDKFMVILATNQPDQLDWAINDRIDEIVPFDLPSEKERERILEQYFEQYVVNHSLTHGTKPIHVLGVGNEELRNISKRTEGFSGRELSKLVIGWQAAAYGSLDNTLTLDMVEKVLEQRVAQRKQKDAWEN